MEQKLNSIPPDGAAAQKQYEAEFSKSSQTIRQTPCYTPCICPDCGGTGIIVDYVAVCCLNPDEDGNCCNCPIPEPIQAQCCRCEATGYLRSVGIAFNVMWLGEGGLVGCSILAEYVCPLLPNPCYMKCRLV